MFRRGLLMALLLLAEQSTCSGEQPKNYEEFKARVQQFVRLRRLPLKRPDLDWTGSALVYSFEPPFDRSGATDEWVVPLEQQLIVESIRTYRLSNRQQREFWGRVLPRVEKEIEGMVNTILTEQDMTKRSDAVFERQSSIHTLYHDELDRLARAQGYAEGARHAGVAAPIWEISVMASPSNATIKYMSAGQWHVYRFNNNGKDPGWTHEDWNSAAHGQQIVIGDYTTFLIRWTDGKTHLESSVFTNDQGVTRTFHRRGYSSVSSSAVRRQ